MNPFTSQTSEYDKPVNLHGTKQEPAGNQDNAVLFDAANRTGSRAALSFSRWLEQRVVKRSTELNAKMLTEVLRPVVKRVEALEQALEVEAGKTADLLENAAREFLNEGEPDLDEMARRHHEKMERVKNG